MLCAIQGVWKNLWRRGAQKGQLILEFALVLPFLLVLIIGSINFGFFFADYVALNNVARSVAREAALQEGNDFSQIRTRALNQSLPLKGVFAWGPSTTQSQFSIEDQPIQNSSTGTGTTTASAKSNIVVKIKLPLDSNYSFYSLLNHLLGQGSNPQFTTNIQYVMLHEAGSSSSST